MANLIIRFYHNGFNFELMGKPVSVLEVRQSEYVLTESDEVGFKNELIAAAAKYGDEWAAVYTMPVLNFIKVLKEHSEFMVYWQALKLVEVNQESEILQAFAHFDAGEDISTIWLWLEDKFPKIKIADYL